MKQLRREQTQNASTEEWVRQAKSFEYYWMSAYKKIDIREIEFFGTLAARVIRDRRTYLGIDRLHSLWRNASQGQSGNRGSRCVPRRVRALHCRSPTNAGA